MGYSKVYRHFYYIKFSVFYYDNDVFEITRNVFTSLNKIFGIFVA